MKLVVKCLPRDLDADAKHNGRVDHLFFEGSQENLTVAFSAFLDRLDLLICGDHDLVQVDVIVQVIVELKPFERLEHLVDLVLELLDELFVFNPELALAQQQILLCNPLTLLVQNPLERLVLVLLHLHNLRLHIDDLTQNIQLI